MATLIQNEPMKITVLDIKTSSDHSKANEAGDASVTFRVETSLSNYSRPVYTITRSLAEFDRLFVYLTRRCPEFIPPAAPPKSCDIAFVHWSTSRFLQRLASHDALRVAEGTRLFIESEFMVPFFFLFVSNNNIDWSQFVAPPSPPAARRLNQASKSLFGFTSTPSTHRAEVDVFYDDAKRDADAFESFVSAIGRINEKIANVYNGLSLQLHSFIIYIFKKMFHFI